MADDFAGVIGEQLAIIDAYLATVNVEPFNRPFVAATLFVKKCIVSINGQDIDPKSDYLDAPWFRDIYRETKKWYVSRYGERLRNTLSTTASGLVLVFGTLFRLEVPLVVEELVEGGERKWVSFPDGVLPEETPLSWLKPPPNLTGMSNDDRQALDANAKSIANTIRECTRDMVMAVTSRAADERLANSISKHLSTGVDHALSDEAGRTLAVWEFHLAVEKSIKLFLMQKSVVVPHAHDLWKLCELAESHGLTGIDRQLLAIMPSYGDAIKHRYGELGAVSAARICEIYQTALSLCTGCGRRLQRNLRTRNLRFLIRKLPWV